MIKKQELRLPALEVRQSKSQAALQLRHGRQDAAQGHHHLPDRPRRESPDPGLPAAGGAIPHL